MNILRYFYNRIARNLFLILLFLLFIRLLYISTHFSQTNELISAAIQTKLELDSKPDVNTLTNTSFNQSLSFEKLSSFITKINSRSNQFPNSITPNLVLVIQIHNRVSYFHQLISSLSLNKGIHETLIVVSSDYFDYSIYRYIMNINFTTVLPIYYPYSIQLYPFTFPGNDPNDCPKKVSYAEAIKLGCNNAAYPDQYGNYREAQYTAIKHHWFWKISTVFDKLHPLKTYNGYVLFLEEDHYVFPDFVTSALQLIKLRESSCPECSFINLGTYNNDRSYKESSNLAQIQEWTAGEHNMGFGMDRNVWNKIKDCSKFFCNFDDYNWDWTLQATGLQCYKNRFRVLVLLCPRIFHLGDCGIHHKNLECDPINSAQHILNKILNEITHLFPDSIELQHSPVKPASMPNPKGFGGWGDERDRILCLSYTNETYRENLFYH